MIEATFWTMSNAPTPEPLDSARAARLIAFARTCAAAVRALALYPAGHPAGVAVLKRLVDTVAAVTAAEPLRATVLPRQLLVNGRAPANPDPALAELAALLHEPGACTRPPSAPRTNSVRCGRASRAVRTDSTPLGNRRRCRGRCHCRRPARPGRVRRRPARVSLASRGERRASHRDRRWRCWRPRHCGPAPRPGGPSTHDHVEEGS